MSKQEKLITEIAGSLIDGMSWNENEVPMSAEDFSWAQKDTLRMHVTLRFYDLDNNGDNDPKLFKKYSKQATQIITKFRSQLESLGIRYSIAQSEKGWFPIEFLWSK